MTKKVTKHRKRGRPFKAFPPNLVLELEELARIGCTNDEIVAVLSNSVKGRISWNTLDRNYGDVIKKGRDEMKASLRRSQFRLALEGNPAMNIWLGKQLLGQREPPHEITPPADGAAFNVEVIRRVIVDAAGHPDR